MRSWLSPLSRLRGDPLLWLLLAIALAFVLIEPDVLGRIPGLVDGQTIAALTGLLVLTKAVEASGALDSLANWLVRSVANQRQLALSLVAAAALLSMVVTNDVALFAVVPLTVSLRRTSHLPIARLVILEALAVNAGSSLTPMGNPQNLYLWQRFSVPFGQFVVELLPVCAVGVALVFTLTWVSFGGTDSVGAPAPPSAPDKKLWRLGLALYGPFLICAELHVALPALVVLLLVFALTFPQILVRVDWPLIVVVALMFIDLRLVSGTAVATALMQGAELADPHHLYWAAVGVSQIASNVPAAILLTEYSHNVPVIGAGVNVGGYGLAIGSLANLIALRLLGQPRAWLEFHLYSIPFLVANAVLVYSWLFLR